MKKSTVILLLIAVCLLLCCCSVNSYRYADSRRYTAGGANVNGRVESIDLSWIDGSVTVAYHKGDDVRLSEQCSRRLDREDELHWWLDGNTLYVKYAESGVRLAANLNKHLTVLLPEGMTLDKLMINTVSAEVDAEEITADMVDINTVSGDVKADVERVKSMKVNTVSGGVTLRFDREAEKLGVNTVSGNVEIALPANADVTATVETVSGNVNGDLPMIRDGNDYTLGNGRYDINVDTVSGNVRVDTAN